MEQETKAVPAAPHPVRMNKLSLTRTLEMPGAPPAAFSPGGLPARRKGKFPDFIRVSNSDITIASTEVAASSAQISSWPKLVRLSLTMRTEDDSLVSLANIPFKVSIADDGEITFSSKDQETHWKFLIHVDRYLKQLTLSFTLNYAGLSVEETLKALAFYAAIARGGKLRIVGKHPVTRSDLAIASTDIRSGVYPDPDIRLMELVEQLALIERKTGVSFSIPSADISYEAASTIAMTARIVETGHAEYEAQPWVSVSPIEQAKLALDTFTSGAPALMAIHFAGQVVVIFGTPVMLGPVTLFCERTYITAEDLEHLRQQLKSASDESKITIRFTPFENCPIEARYVNWLPENEAEAIRQLPMLNRDKFKGEDDSPILLSTPDVAEAVLLLESWYQEDADEQRTSWNLIKAALERDRLSDRELF